MPMTTSHSPVVPAMSCEVLVGAFMAGPFSGPRIARRGSPVKRYACLSRPRPERYAPGNWPSEKSKVGGRHEDGIDRLWGAHGNGRRGTGGGDQGARHTRGEGILCRAGRAVREGD